MYKKFLTQSKVSGEEWASKVMDSVVKVQEVVARIHILIGNLQLMEIGGVNTKALADACAQVMRVIRDPICHPRSACVYAGLRVTHLHLYACFQVAEMTMPPKKRRHAACTCSITGVKMAVEEGLEILKKKDESSSKKKKVENSEKTADIVVHPRFMHFFHMLWLVCRVDHILRNMARAWAASGVDSSSINNAALVSSSSSSTTRPTASSSDRSSNSLLHDEKKDEVEGIDLCQRFSDSNAERIDSMGIMFQHAASHVEKSMLALSG